MKHPTKPLTVRLRLPIHADLDKRADALGVDKADIVRQLIIDGLRTDEHLALLDRQLEEFSERILEQNQEIQKLQALAIETKKWIDSSTIVFMAYAGSMTPEEAHSKWEEHKQQHL